MGKATVESDGHGTRRGSLRLSSPLLLVQKCVFLQCNSVESCNSNKILTAKNAKNTETRAYGAFSLRSLWSIRLWLRLAALGLLRLFAANQLKFLSMNNLLSKVSFFQSR